MYKEVYNHHTVRAIEYMMKDFIKGMDKMIGIKYNIENEKWEDFIQLNDSITDQIYFYKKLRDEISEQSDGCVVFSHLDLFGEWDYDWGYLSDEERDKLSREDRCEMGYKNKAIEIDGLIVLLQN